MIKAAFKVKKTITSQRGQGLTEYALIIGFVAICVMMALSVIPEPISEIIAAVAEALGISP
jgi:Flp pilus assembly pilin Flp